MSYKAGLTISRPQGGDGEKKISIRVKDRNSQNEFLHLSIGLEEFSEALTGLAACECSIEVRGLEYVGKIKERKYLIVELVKGASSLDRKEEAIKLAYEVLESGWLLDRYLGSQDSFFTEDCIDYARLSVYRYVYESL